MQYKSDKIEHYHSGASAPRHPSITRTVLVSVGIYNFKEVWRQFIHVRQWLHFESHYVALASKRA